MGGHRLQYLTIFLTVFIDVLGFGIVIPVLPLYAEHFGATEFAIGWLVGIFSLMQFFFAPVWGRLSDRYGRKPILVVGMVGTVAGYVMMGFAGSVLALFVARLIAGIAGANLGVAQAYLADISPPEKRARAMGLIGAAFGLGFVFGPALGGLASAAFGYAAPMFVAAGLGAINFVFVLVFLPESRQGKPAEGGPVRRLAVLDHVRRGEFGWAMVAYFVTIAGFSMMTAIFALYLLHRFGLGVRETGAVLAGIGFLGAFVQGGLIGRLVKRFGEEGLALTGVALMAAGLAGLAVAPVTGVMLAAAAAVGIGNSLVMPCLSSLASRATESDWQGRALGVLQSAGSLARFFGPLAAGALLATEPEAVAYGLVPLGISAGVLGVAFFAVYALGRATADRTPPG